MGMEKRVDFIRVYGKGCYGCLHHPDSVVMVSYYQDKEEYTEFLLKKFRAEGIPIYKIDQFEVPPVDLFLTKEQARGLLIELQKAVEEIDK
jgi:hypothetical protein